MNSRPRKLLWYYGRHPLMTDRDYCMKCKDRRKDARVFCRSCKFYVYCCKTCRDADKMQHKTICCRILKNLKEAERFEENVDVAMAIYAATQGRRPMYDDNYKMLMVYVRARQRVATEMHFTARKFFMNRLWQQGNDILEEHVNLVGEQNDLVCYEFLQGLLNQGRIDEALVFCIEKLSSSNRIENEIRWMDKGPILPFSDETLLNEKNDAYIVFIFLSYLIMLSSYSSIKQFLDTFNQTDFGRSLVERLCHGPQSIVLSYLVPFSFGSQIITWKKVIRTCEELQSETLRLACILKHRKCKFISDLDLISRGSSITRDSESRLVTNEQRIRSILLKTKHCIMNIPNLNMWLEYAFQHS